MVVGISRLELHFAESRSLKDKRRGLRRIIDRTRARFNAAVAEVAAQDAWQRGVVAIAVVSGEERHAQSMLDTIVAFIDQLMVAQIVFQEDELLHYSDGEPLASSLDGFA